MGLYINNDTGFIVLNKPLACPTLLCTLCHFGFCMFLTHLNQEMEKCPI